MPLILHRPLLMSKLFVIPVDTTPWHIGQYNKVSGGQTPNRTRASFVTLAQALTPKNDCGKQLVNSYGIYILAFDVPHCHLYVGIAAKGTGRGEGIFSRIRKHRVKATGSHVGVSANKCGGVNHTIGWRKFAICRAFHFRTQRRKDSLDEARLIVGTLSNGKQDKKTLEAYENAIVLNENNILDLIKQALWPTGCVAQSMITVRVTSHKESFKDIKLWNKWGPDFCKQGHMSVL